MPFSVHAPRSARIPVVVEIPHAGLSVDPESLATLIAPAQAIGRDADLYVDELYADAPDRGAAMLVAHFSRYVCDLNRDVQDIDAQAVEGGPSAHAPHGLIWRTTTDDRPALSAPLADSELERRIREIYRPYHAALQALLAEVRGEFGYVILLSAHSMPSRGRGPGPDLCDRADVVPGTRGGTTAAPAVIAQPERLATTKGWSVSHDVPYRGGFTTGHYGRPRQGVHAIQVELARRLYMDETTLEKHQAFPSVRAFCADLTAALGEVRLS